MTCRLSVLKAFFLLRVICVWCLLVLLSYPLTLICAEKAIDRSTLVLTPDQISHIGIVTAIPESISTLPLLQTPGRVVLPPNKEFIVSTLQSGIVTHVDVSLGEKVLSGQVLAKIRSIGLLDLQRAVLDAVSALNVAKARVERDDTLFKEGIISRLRWQETRSDYDRAIASLQTTEQALLASGFNDDELKQLKSSQKINSLFYIRAINDGVVLERMVVAGQRVDAPAPLFRLGQLDALWLELSVPQERLREVKAGDRVKVDNPKATARVIEISQYIDTQSQSALVRAVAESGQSELRPGMNLNVQLMHNSTDYLVRVPIAAVFSHEGRYYIFVKTPEGFSPREVSIAGQETYYITLDKGVHPGETVAVQGVAALKAAWLGTEAHE